MHHVWYRYPFLVDRAASVSLFESEDICNHLVSTYGGEAETLPADAESAGSFYSSTFLLGLLPSLLRAGRGGFVDESVVGAPPPAQPLVLYSYEGNQFCRLVREVLAELYT